MQFNFGHLTRLKSILRPRKLQRNVPPLGPIHVKGDPFQFFALMGRKAILDETNFNFIYLGSKKAEYFLK